MTKVIRSKYGFSSLKVGDRFNIDPIDLASMRSSLSAYNKKYNLKLELSVKPVSKSKLEIERIK